MNVEINFQAELMKAEACGELSVALIDFDCF